MTWSSRYTWSKRESVSVLVGECDLVTLEEASLVYVVVLYHREHQDLRRRGFWCGWPGDLGRCVRGTAQIAECVRKSRDASATRARRKGTRRVLFDHSRNPRPTRDAPRPHILSYTKRQWSAHESPVERSHAWPTSRLLPRTPAKRRQTPQSVVWFFHGSNRDGQWEDTDASADAQVPSSRLRCLLCRSKVFSARSARLARAFGPLDDSPSAAAAAAVHAPHQRVQESQERKAQDPDQLY